MDDMVDDAADNGNTSATRLTTPAQQGQQCQHNEGHDVSTKTKKVTMQA
jgi:hypothetical protein